MQTIEELIKIIQLQQDKLLEQENRLLEQERLIRKLREEIISLQEKLNTNSTNSSLPPSQDPNREKKSKYMLDRKAGGQLGHQGHSRKLFPLEQVRQNIDVYPNACPNCGEGTFEFSPVKTHIHQQIELPEIKPEVTQFNFHTCRCGKCGKHVAPKIPQEAQKGFGPRLMGFIETLTIEGRATKRIVVKLLEYLGISISSGSVSNIHKLASDILKGPYDTIKAEVLGKKINADETSWYTNGKRKWLWIGATQAATFFQIDSFRSGAACKRVFGDFKGTLTSDRYSAYNVLNGPKQSCWAHLDRDFKKIEERGGVDGVIGKTLTAVAARVFMLWREFKTGALTREELQDKMKDVIDVIEATLKVGAGAKQVSSKTQATCRNVLSRFGRLWTFLYQEGVEPTNNLAERNLRPGVIWRKLTAGSRSEWGEKYVERLFTIVTTIRQRAGNVFKYLVDCFSAWQRAGPIPNPVKNSLPP